MRQGFLWWTVPVLFLFAWMQGGRLAYHLLGFFIAIFVMASLFWLTPIRRIRAERLLPPGPFSSGDTLTVTVRLTLPRWWPWFYISIHDHVPVGLVTQESSAFLAFPWFRPSLALQYRMVNVPRGVHRFGPLVVESGDLFGFFRRRQTVDLGAQEVEVWPVVVPLRGVHSLPQEWQGDLRRHSLHVDESNELRGIRDFVTGDRLNRIHWQTTAKTGAFKVKQFEPLTIPELQVVVDYPATFTPHQYEVALSAAASLVQYALYRGQMMGVYLIGPDLAVAPRFGANQMAAAMHALASARWTRQEPAHVVALAGGGQAVASIVITGRSPGDLHLRGGRPAMILYIGRQDTGVSIERLQDLPDALAMGGVV